MEIARQIQGEICRLMAAMATMATMAAIATMVTMAMTTTTLGLLYRGCVQGHGDAGRWWKADSSDAACAKR